MNWYQSISEEKFAEKYMINDGDSSPSIVFEKVAEEIASVEKTPKLRERYGEKFYNIMNEGLFCPGGRTLANARPGTKNPYYVNCYGSAISDSLSDIYDTLKKDALINQTGGGDGINFSTLRPMGAPISRGGKSSGPVSFMELFDVSGKVILTGGNRRAARIFLLNVDHPDILEFITSKRGDLNKSLTQANLSVVITDEFMRAVKYNKQWNLQYGGVIYKTLPARELYDIIVKHAYEHNEPGVFFIDRVNKDNLGYYGFDLDVVNPCGELPLSSKGGACNLGSIFLHKFILDPFTEKATFDTDSFNYVVGVAIRFLDNVVSATQYPLPNIAEMQHNWRKVGLGFSGLADAMAMLRVSYGSRESVEFAGFVSELLRNASYGQSALMAHEKGTFPKYDKEKVTSHKFIHRLPKKVRELINKHGLRNVGLNSIAPTGTISLTFGQNCSSGIEPIFSVSHNRTIKTGDGDKSSTEQVHNLAWLLYNAHQFKENRAVEDIPEFFNTVEDIDPYDSLNVQAEVQKHIDSSISKTANLPSDYSFEQYKDLFFTAWKSGLKGFTSFNPSGSLRGILTNSEEDTSRPQHIIRSESPKRPKELECDIHIINIKGARHVALVGLLNGTVYEIFVTNDEDGSIDVNRHKKGKIIKIKKGKYDLYFNDDGEDRLLINDIGKVFDSTYASLSRMISMSLRHGTPLQFVVDQLGKDPNFAGFDKTVARVLKKYIKDGEVVTTSDKCQECGSDMYFKEGCKICPNCGWSKCI